MFKLARIEPERQQAFDVLFNPTHYSVDKANQFAEAAVPGLEAPIIQYVHGNTRTLSIELFFDTYEERTDVSQHTERVYNLLLIDPGTHAPPICRITWGSFTFRGVLAQASGKFTLFLPDGTPARATVNVTFKEYIEVRLLVRARPTRSADHRTVISVQLGDTLPIISHRAYGDPRRWRDIADANQLEDPDTLVPGTQLVIPKIV
jgi:nucleoid-associated protein YgaU